MHIIGLATIASLVSLVAALKVQDPIFHGTGIRAAKHADKCDYKLDLSNKANASALRKKLRQKKADRVWVSKTQQVILRSDGHIYLKRKYNDELKNKLPYVCGSKPYRPDDDGKKKKKKGKKAKKTAAAKKFPVTKATKPEETEVVEDDTKADEVEKTEEHTAAEETKTKAEEEATEEKKSLKSTPKKAKKAKQDEDDDEDEEDEEDEEDSDDGEEYEADSDEEDDDDDEEETEVLSASSEEEEKSNKKSKKGKLLSTKKKGKKAAKKSSSKKNSHRRPSKKHRKYYESDSEDYSTEEESSSESVSYEESDKFAMSPGEYNKFQEFLEKKGKVKRSTDSKTGDKMLIKKSDLKSFLKQNKH